MLGHAKGGKSKSARSHAGSRLFAMLSFAACTELVPNLSHAAKFADRIFLSTYDPRAATGQPAGIERLRLVD